MDAGVAGKALVMQRVVADLVTVAEQLLHHRRLARNLVADLEERSLGPGAIEDRHHARGVRARAVVEGERDLLAAVGAVEVDERRCDAAPDTLQLEEPSVREADVGSPVETPILGSPHGTRAPTGPALRRRAGRRGPSAQGCPAEAARLEVREREPQLDPLPTLALDPRPEPPAPRRRSRLAVARDADRDPAVAGLTPRAEQASPDPPALELKAEISLVRGGEPRREALQFVKRRQLAADPNRPDDAAPVLVEPHTREVQRALGVVGIAACRGADARCRRAGERDDDDQPRAGNATRLNADLPSVASRSLARPLGSF